MTRKTITQPAADRSENPLVGAETAKELLEAATQGPWLTALWSDDGERGRPVVADFTRCYIVAEASATNVYDQRLIAAAPDLARTVIAQAAEVERLQAQLAAVRELHSKDHDVCGFAYPCQTAVTASA